MNGRARRWLAAFSILVLTFFAVLWNMESMGAAHVQMPAPTAAGNESTAPAHRGTARLFVLAIDSLRYSTAMSSRLMPTLAHLRPKSTYAKVVTTNDAVTVPSMRAAFTGRDHVSPFDVLESLGRGRPAIESIFDQAARAGMKVEIRSDGSFDQFGEERVATMLPNLAGDGSDWDRQDIAANLAIDDFVSKQYDVVVAHVTYGDHAAHGYGARAPEYWQAFRRLDRLVQRAALSISRADTLVVMGDHGHTNDGNHAMGLEVPTFLLYRGPGFARGLDLGTVSITDHRYLASFALELPLAGGYARGRHPRALIAEGALPPAFAEPRDALAGRTTIADFPASERVNAGLLAACLGLLAFSWLLDVRGPSSSLQTGSLAVAIVPLFFASLRPYHAVVALTAGSVWLLRHGSRAAGARRRALGGALLTIAACIAVAAWGRALAGWRPEVHEPGNATIDRAVLIAMAVSAALAVRFGAMAAAWSAMVALSVFGYPTVYRYGAPALFASLWVCFILLVCFAELRAWIRAELARGPRSDRLAARLRLLKIAALSTPALLLLFAFTRTFSRQFTFEEWHGPLAPDSASDWLIVAAAAKGLVFVRPWGPHGFFARASPRRARWATLLTGVGVTLLLSSIEWQWIDGRGATVLAAIGALAATAALARGAPWTGLRRVASLGLVWMVAIHALRFPGETWAWADWLFAVVALSADIVERSADPTVRSGGRLYVIMLGLFVAGWVAFGWTVQRPDVGFLYDWLPKELVDRHIAWFAPLLVARSVLVVWIVRRIVGDAMTSEPAGADLLVLGGAKFFSLAALSIGLGAFSIASDVYVEAFGELGIVLVLVLGLWSTRSSSNPALMNRS